MSTPNDTIRRHAKNDSIRRRQRQQDNRLQREIDAIDDIKATYNVLVSNNWPSGEYWIDGTYCGDEVMWRHEITTITVMHDGEEVIAWPVQYTSLYIKPDDNMQAKDARQVETGWFGILADGSFVHYGFGLAELVDGEEVPSTHDGRGCVTIADPAVYGPKPDMRLSVFDASNLRLDSWMRQFDGLGYPVRKEQFILEGASSVGGDFDRLAYGLKRLRKMCGDWAVYGKTSTAENSAHSGNLLSWLANGLKWLVKK